MKKYIKNFKSANKEFWMYKTNFIIRSFFLLFILLVTYALWKAIYAENSYSSSEFRQLIWYLFLTRTISMCLTDIHTEIISDIRTGRIIVCMNKPYNFIFFKLYGSFGKIFSPSIITFALVFILGSGLTGTFFSNISFSGIICSLFLVFNGILIDWFIKFFISILSFWVNEVKGILLVYNRLILFLGGVMIPFDILPNWLKQISVYLPMNFIVNQPANVFVNYNNNSFFRILFGQIIYIIVLLCITFIAYKRGVKHVSINGG